MADKNLASTAMKLKALENIEWPRFIEVYKDQAARATRMRTPEEVRNELDATLAMLDDPICDLLWDRKVLQAEARKMKWILGDD
jgi:hypothetical protein